MKAKMHKATTFGYGLLMLCLLSLWALDVQAQDIGGGGGSLGESANVRSGTAGAAELLVPLTARYTALGASTTSGLVGMNGIEALFANPAGLALNQGTAALFSRLDYVADIGVNYFGVAQSFNGHNLAFTIAAWDFGEIFKQTEASPEISDVTFDVSFFTAGLSYARQLTDRIAAGATIKVVSESIDDISASALAIDAGMTYVVGESGWRLGVSLKNIGNELTFAGTGLIRQVSLPNQDPSANVNAVAIESEGVQLPALLNFGASYTREVGAGAVVTVLGNFRSNSFDQDQYSGAVELGFQDIIYIRGGYQLTDNMDQTFFKGVTFGAGLNLDLGGSKIAIDYAIVPTDFFDDLQYITASVTL